MVGQPANLEGTLVARVDDIFPVVKGVDLGEVVARVKEHQLNALPIYESLPCRYPCSIHLLFLHCSCVTHNRPLDAAIEHSFKLLLILF